MVSYFLKVNNTQTNLPDLKNKPFGGGYSVHDSETCAVRDLAVHNYMTDQYSISHDEIKNNFLSTYKDWIFSTHPGINGWQEYNHLCFTQGTTESFAQFYLRYRDNKRLRLRQGEYFYSQMMKNLWYKNNFAWLNEDDVQPNDVVLISAPFGDTGAVPEELEKLLTKCDDANVPVMLDLAYVNLAVDMEIDLSHKCIEYVVSSLSKVFPIEHYRVGIRMQRQKFEDQLYVVNDDQYNYINLLSVYVGQKLIQKFDASFIHNKYKSKQSFMCQQLEVEPSPCVYFGIDHKQKFSEYNRGGQTNRLCFSRIWDGRKNYV